MGLVIRCPKCGRDDELSGQREGETVVVTCASCGNVWRRVPGRTCGECGGVDVQAVAYALVDKARGTQLSVLGLSHRLLCRECDADELARHAARDSGRLILPEELPTASGDHRPHARVTTTDASTPMSGGQ